MRTLGFLAAVAAFLAVGPVQAQDAETRRDLRCIASIAAVAGSAKDAAAANSAIMGFLYYLGRAEGRERDLNLENALRREVVLMKPSDIRAEALRCGEQLKSKGVQLQAIGRSMQAVETPPES